MPFLALESYLVSLLSVFQATPHILLPALQSIFQTPKLSGMLILRPLIQRIPKTRLDSDHTDNEDSLKQLFVRLNDDNDGDSPLSHLSESFNPRFKCGSTGLTLQCLIIF